MEHGSLFNTTGWADHFDLSRSIYGFYNSNNEIIGGFTLAFRKIWGLTLITNLPLTPFVGPVANIEAIHPVSRLTAWKSILTEMAAFLDDIPRSIVSVPLGRGVMDMQPFTWRKFKSSSIYTYLLDLTRSRSELWNNFSSERRKSIRKAEKDGITVEKIDDYSVVDNLSKQTFDRQGMIHVPHQSRLLNELSPKESFAHVSFLQGEPLAGCLCVHDTKTAYYLVGGYSSSNRHHGAGALAFWHSIQHSQSLELGKYDFEGSMVPGIERYFRDFGGDLTPSFRINKANLFLEMLLKIRKREFF